MVTQLVKIEHIMAGNGMDYFAEIISFGTKLPDATRQKVEGYLAHKWGLVGNLPSNHPYKQSVTKQPKIAISSIGTNSATVSANLVDLGGAATSLKVVFAKPNGTILETPETLSGLKLWLDASDLNTAGSSWADKSGNNNAGTKTGSLLVITNAQNGLSVMHYTGNGQWHEWSDINDIRTVFWVVSQDSMAQTVQASDFYFGVTSGSHFHQMTITENYWGNSAHNNIRNGATRMSKWNLVFPDIQIIQINLSIISLKTLGNVECRPIW